MANRVTEYASTEILESDFPRFLSSRYDRLFKSIIGIGWAVKSDGEVDSLSGFFALVEIPAHEGEFNELLDALNVGQPEALCYEESEFPASGWYTTVETSTGFIYVFEHATEAAAVEAYKESLYKYMQWLDGDPIEEIAPKASERQ